MRCELNIESESCFLGACMRKNLNTGPYCQKKKQLAADHNT